MRRTLSPLSIFLTSTIALLAGATPGHAADAAGKYAVRGAGGSPCATFLSALSAKNQPLIDQYASWLMGYVSAVNRLQAQTFDAMPTMRPGEMVALAAMTCKLEPKLTVELAAARGLNAVSALRAGQESPVVTLTSDGRTVQIRQQALTTLQRNLSARGMFTGAANGAASPALTVAIKAFQTQVKLPATGLPDLDTILRASAPAPAAAPAVTRK